MKIAFAKLISRSISTRWFQIFGSQIPTVYQAEEAECGLACLAMLIGYFGGEPDLNRLRQAYLSTRGGIGVVQLAEFSALFGIRLIVETNFELSQLNKESLPCIAFWNGEHYVVIADRSDNYLVIHDPDLGFTRIKMEVALQKFSNLILRARIIPAKFQKKKTNIRDLFSLPKGVNWREISPLFIFLILVLIVISSIFEIGSAQIQSVFFDWVIQGNQFTWSSPLGYLQIILGLIIALSTYIVGIFVARKYSLIAMQWNQAMYLRLLRLPETFFLERTSGDVIAKFNNVDQILKASQSSFINLSTAFLNLFVLLFILSATNVGLLLMVIIVVILSISIAILFNKVELAQQQQDQQISSQSQKAIYDIVSDFQQIRLEGREHFYLTQLFKAELSNYRVQNRLNNLFAKESFILKTIDTVTSMLLLIGAAFLIMDGQMTLGRFAALDALLSMTLSPLLNLSNVLRTLQDTRVAYARLNDITSFPLDSRYRSKKIKHQDPDARKGLLTFTNVSYQYSIFSDPLFSNLNLNFLPDALPCCIQGDNGVGKTSLAKIIAGRVKPTRGFVSIDQTKLIEMSSHQLNSNVIVVDGKPILNRGSIAANFCYGTSLRLGDILILAEELDVSTLSIFSKLQENVSGSKGELSGGELVLIQLFRALSLKPKILILDEILSVIAPRYHQGIVEGILKRHPKTIFITNSVPAILKDMLNLRIFDGKIIKA